MPARQTRVFVPSEEPFEDWAETLIGKVFRLLTAEFDDSLEWFWFSRYASSLGEHGDSGDCKIELIRSEYKQPINQGEIGFHRSMRFRYAIANEQLPDFERRARELIENNGYQISDFRPYDYVTDTGSNRFLGVENRTPGRAESRAVLVTQFYAAISRLIIDALVGPDDQGRYRLELSDDRGNNPRGSTFQSLLHLFCNMTNVPTDVYVFRNSSLNLFGLGTFMYHPPSPPGGWDEMTAHPIQY